MFVNSPNKEIADNYLFHNKYGTTELANKLKLPWIKVRLIETGEYLPDPDLKEKICKILHCTEKDLYRPHVPFKYRKKSYSRKLSDKKFII